MTSPVDKHEAHEIGDHRLNELIEENTGYGADVPTGRVHSTMRMGELLSVLQELQALRLAATARDEEITEMWLQVAAAVGVPPGTTLAESINCIDSMRDRLAAREWQPIETAPKDRLIDIWIPFHDGGGTRWASCYYDSICDEWRTGRPSGHLVSVKAKAVTRWMPLPEDPK